MVTHPILVLGYHGCNRTTADKVLRGEIQHLPLSTEKHEWLGDGVYFWENSYDRALKWAEEKYEKDAAVVGAIILPGHCLDLTDSLCTTLLAEYANIFPRDYKAKYGKPAPAHMCPNGFIPALQGVGSHDHGNFVKIEAPPLHGEGKTHGEMQPLACIHPARGRGYVPRRIGRGYPHG